MKKLFIQHPTLTDTYILRIDNSSLELFTTCPRSSEYALVHGRISDSNSSAISYGSAIHKALELRYRACGPYHITEEIEVQMALELQNHFLQNPPPENQWRTLDHAIKTIVAYNKQYPIELFNILNIEAGFSLPLCEIELDSTINYPKTLLVDENTSIDFFHIDKVLVYWTGKIDLLITHNDLPCIVDHKTTSFLGPTFWQDFELSQQVHGYCWAATQILNTPVQTALLNILAVRPPTKTGKSIEFARKFYHYRPDQIDSWQTNTENIISDFLSNLTRQYFPQHTKWCLGKYGLCSYHDICCSQPYTRIPILNALFSPRTWSPLETN